MTVSIQKREISGHIGKAALKTRRRMFRVGIVFGMPDGVEAEIIISMNACWNIA